MGTEGDEWVRRADLADLVDIPELRRLLGRVSRRREPVASSYAHTISTSKGFPDPLIVHARVRLWLRADIEAWFDQRHPGWRD